MILHYGDLTDATNLIRIVQEVRPHEIYNLAAQSHVAVSFETAEYTANSDALGTLRLLEAIRICGLGDGTKFYQASSSEMFGKVAETPQRETTPFYPRSPYARREGLRLLDHGELSRGLRPLRLQRHPVQSRIARARRNLRHAQDHARPRAHQGRARRVPVPGQPRRAARLGPRARLRPRAVADAAARRRPRTTSSRPASSTRCATFVERAAAELGMPLRWHGAGARRARRSTRNRAAPSSASIRVTSGPPRSIRCSAMRRRHARSSAGRRRSRFAELVARDGRVRSGGWRSATRSSSAKASPPTSTTNEQGRPRLRGRRARPRRLRDLPRAGGTRLRRRAGAARSALDLRDRAAVDRFFASERPEYVFMAAAKVGGIVANDTYPADFIRDNLEIQTNVIDAAYRNGTRKLCFLGSSCIYPRLAPQPMHGVVAADGSARADQPVVRGREDRRHQDVPGLPPPARLQRDLRDADQPLRPRRQLRPARRRTSCRRCCASSTTAKQSGATEVTRLGHRHAAPRVPATSTTSPTPVLPDGALRLAGDHQRRLRART